MFSASKTGWISVTGAGAGEKGLFVDVQRTVYSEQCTVYSVLQCTHTNNWIVFFTNYLRDFQREAAGHPVGHGVQLNPKLFSCKTENVTTNH